MTTRIKIVDVVNAREMKVVVCDLLEGDIVSGMIFTSSSNAGLWEVQSITLPSPELHQQGRRAVTMIQISSGMRLVDGDELVTE